MSGAVISIPPGVKHPVSGELIVTVDHVVWKRTQQVRKNVDVFCTPAVPPHFALQKGKKRFLKKVGQHTPKPCSPFFALFPLVAVAASAGDWGCLRRVPMVGSVRI
jgi:hypothetical protein